MSMSPTRPKKKSTRSRGDVRRQRFQRAEKRRQHRETHAAEKEQSVEIEGTISSVLAGTMFKVSLANGHTVLAHISGKMRKRYIRLVVGHKVKMEMSPYDRDKARIVYLLR